MKNHKIPLVLTGYTGYLNPKNTVAMTVGKDNRLWIKVGDEWKRVAIEA